MKTRGRENTGRVITGRVNTGRVNTGRVNTGRVYTGGFIRKEKAQTALRLVKTLKNTRAANVQGECHRRPPKAGRQSGLS